MTSITKSEIIEKTPDRVGTTFREYIEQNGRGTEMRCVVIEYIPNKRLVVHLEGDYNSADVCFTQ